MEADINNQYIQLKHNTAQLYILGRQDLHLNFSSLLRKAPDIYRFPTVYMVKTHFFMLLLENLRISEPSLGIMGIFQCRSALPSIKYNCAILFFESYVFVVYV